MTVGQSFDQSVEYYDNWMKLALPSYDEIFSVALALIPFDESDAIEVLDLGAGTGLFSQRVFNKYPRAKFVLYDLAAKMLAIARERFQQHPNQFEYVVIDYRDFQNSRKYDLVISSLSIHHLTDSEKKNLFGQVYRSLKDGGFFINIDQIKGPTQEMQNLYWTNWLRTVREKGAAEEQIQASIARRTKYDQDALLADQLRWLSDTGFVNVDCVYKNYFIGVFFAKKI
jgi:tRNA (cmo5U34)-methyltransferase